MSSTWILLFSALVATSVALNLPGIPIDFTADDRILSAIADDIAIKFENEYMEYVKTGVESTSLQQLSRQLAKSHSTKDIFTKNSDDLDSADKFLSCVTCRATVNIFVRMFRDPEGELNGPQAEDDARKAMLDICERLDIQTEEVCAGLFESNWALGEYIVQNSDIDSRSFCAFFLGYSMCSAKNPEYDWALNVNTGGSPVTGPKNEVLHKSADDLHILHLTDIHYDPLYVAGSLAVCDEPLCCQRMPTSGSVDQNKKAGFWGDYQCDLPMNTVDNSFEHIKSSSPKIDYIYQTGDIIDHMVWGTSIDKNKDVLKEINDKLAESFPSIPVYPAIGNHEPHPLNVFSPSDAPDNINTKWLYEHLYELWSRWLPASTKDTILKGGYYTVSPTAGFRVISLNNNDCYTFNFWLYFRGGDGQTQLQWLHDTLLQAEKDGEFVHILAHIPSGSGDCWTVWAREYNKIIERFRNTISGIFNGHTHKDEMNVHYSSNGHAIGISWNGGSLTTFTDKNPNYRMYEVEPKSWQVVDHETWIYNLTEANLHGESQKPNWFKEYSFAAEFTEDLSPAGLDKLLDQMSFNPDLLRKYWRYKVTMADPALKRGCAKSCLLRTICDLAKSVNDQRTRCQQLQAQLSLTLDNEETTTASTTTSSTTSSTSSSTSAPATTAKPDDEDDGAASIAAMSVSTILTVYLTLKYFI